MPSVIKNIDPGSPAAKTRLQPGDKLISINGNRILDVLDYKYYSYDAKLVFEVERGGKTKKIKLKKPEGMDPGLNFETYLMDRARSCANNCIFCFVDQMPKGMRETLYFKDDDARLSFLMGNYITLTNLSPREIQRIIDLRISPINVSVHSTDPELRCLLLGNRNAGRGIDIMRRFAEAGITMNCQIVCCPGINDGAALDKSMRDLRDMFPAVHSVSIVPVGMTKFRDGLYKLTPFNKDSAGAAIDQVEAFSEKCLRETGCRIFFCSDELYLKAGRELPPDEFYQEYAQLENGVGMLRLLMEEFGAALKTADEPDGAPFSIATGVSAAPFLKKLLNSAQERFAGIRGVVYDIKNDFFGHTIDVAGLVTGGDLIAQLRGKDLGERLLIPANMLRHGEGVFLDDVTLAEAASELGVPIYPVEQDGGALCDAMFGLLPQKTSFRPPVPEDEYYRYNPKKE